MKHNQCLVITSISAPNAALRSFAEGCRATGTNFIVIGDVSSPDDFELEGCDFWSIQRQKGLSFDLAGILPYRHYARKNLGYLLAADQGAELIIESDDDNFPLESFWGTRSSVHDVDVVEEAGWVNAYRYFSDSLIWPRGFPLELVRTSQPPPAASTIAGAFCPIQQGLADENPDVDAIYRLLFPLPQKFSGGRHIAMGKNSWCPFNSQNTTWFREAFPLLYLPSTCSFRMTDIWRSFIAQRLCHEMGWQVLFTAPTVRQERNEHDLMADFSSEITGYKGNGRLCDILKGVELESCMGLADYMTRSYAALIEDGFFQPIEMKYLEAWLVDISRYM